MLQTWALLENLLSEGPALDRLTKYVAGRWDQHEADELVNAMQEVPLDQLATMVATRYQDGELDKLFKSAAAEAEGVMAAHEPPSDDDDEDDEEGPEGSDGPDAEAPWDKPRGGLRLQKKDGGYVVVDQKGKPVSTLFRQGPPLEIQRVKHKQVPGFVIMNTATRRPASKFFRDVEGDESALDQAKRALEELEQKGDALTQAKAYMKKLQAVMPNEVEPKKSVAPWKSPLSNKIKGLPSELPKSEPAPSWYEPEPEEEPEDAAPEEEPGAEAEPEAPEPEEDWRSMVPGRRRPDLPRATGFATPTKMMSTKDQTSQVPPNVDIKRAGKRSETSRAQRELAAFAQKFGPQKEDPPDVVARKQALVQRMARKYGLPIPEFDKAGKPKIKNADALAKWVDSNRETGAKNVGDLSRDQRAAADKRKADIALRVNSKPKFPGSFVGQIVTRNGIAVPKMDYYMDFATGQMNRRKSEINPKYTGPQWIWTGDDWVTLSEIAALKAAGKLDTLKFKPKNSSMGVTQGRPSALPYNWATPRKAKLD